jgi:hypothetical protein
MLNIPDTVFLALGFACLLVLISIRKELRAISQKGRKRKTSEWSLEDQMKHRVKYLHQCKHLKAHLDTIKN